MTVTSLPYELHPEIPVGGISLEERWGVRYGEASAMYARIEADRMSTFQMDPATLS